MKVDRFLADTNLFIQCRALGEIDWRQVSTADTLEIFPAPSAIVEIDRQKSDNSNRRAKRARATSTTFKKMLTDGELLVRESNPRVVLKFAPILSDEARARVASYPEADQRIVEEAIILADQLSNLRVLSHDTGILLRAREKAAPAQVIPDDWLAPPEPDQLSRRMAQMEREISELRDAGRAEITAHIVGNTTIQRQVFSPPDAETIDRAIRFITTPDHEGIARLSQQVRRGRAFAFSLVTEEEVNDRIANVSAWEEKLRERLRELHKTANLAFALAPLSIAISNTGSAPAEDLRVRISCEGRLKLVAEEASELLWSASPSELAQARIHGAPRWPINQPSWRKRAPSIFDPEYLRTAYAVPTVAPSRHIRDRYSFHRTSHDEDTLIANEIVFECDDFRHGLGETILHFAVLLPQEDGSSSLSVEVSAKVGSPLKQRERINYASVPADIAPMAEKIVEAAAKSLEDDD